ncbi:hypothetical protein CLV84_1124 [Neolewinella xylanilytica]|uniref:AsmA-like protein n=1 Tax=Neolewinella xylanilytica TaxID=1514080 RepID=A0A2S6I9M3_9BACT|nr:hypothetical protein [Neolewinella xylanilytica]PPK88159.1 hypothetical protein CLV84_1124 [Neolewinella xylanilytica]
MVKRLFRWFLILLGLVVLLLAGFAVALNAYLNSEEEKLVREYAYPAGLDIVFRKVDLTAWESFPLVSLTIDSLVVRDSSLTRNDPALLELHRLHAEFSLASLFSDTISLRRLQFTGGGLRMVADSSGTFNTGTLLDRDSTAAREQDPTKRRLPRLAWEGVRIGVTDLGFTYRLPPRNKWIDVHIDSLQALAFQPDDGNVILESHLVTTVGQLAFNTQKGGYLKNTRVEGPVDVLFTEEEITVCPTELVIGGEAFTVSAEIRRSETDPTFIYVANDRTSYPQARPLLHEDLQQKLGDYFVSGRFPVRATIELPPGENEKVTIDFSLSGQDVTAKGYDFTNVSTRGEIVNRLDPAEGGIPGSKKNLRVELDSLSAYYLGARIESPRAVVAVFGKDAVLRAPLRLSGPASAVSTYLENRDFFFDRGRFELLTQVDASLLSFEDVATTSDGSLQLDDLVVGYRPAAASFPFRSIRVEKNDQDITFLIESTPLANGFSFDLAGRVDNLTPLLIDVPDARLNTDVTLTAPRINWTDFLTFFGQGGYFPQDETDGPDTTITDAATQSRALKETLRGIQHTFSPQVDATFDTVGYYDVFTLTDFGTGLHFNGDTLVLERTAFNWAGSQVGFGAELNLAMDGQTPFHLSLAAEHLNLNELRSSLDYFGVYIPEGIDSLPEDLSIDFDHQGRIADSLGIEPGFNTGRLAFHDGRSELFAGRMDYEPGPNGLVTDIHLGGDPHVVNVLFGAEDFFFGTGNFTIDLSLVGTPTDLRQLVQTGNLRLRIDSSRIAYRPADVFVPLRSFAVDITDARAEYRMELLADGSERSVSLSGALNNINAFLYPRPGENFRVTADAYAPSLFWSDLSGFVQGDGKETTDSAPDLQSLFSTAAGALRSFRPDISLAIDTLYTGETAPLVHLYSGLRLQDSTRLLLERSGFQLADGRVAFDASYDLDTAVISPFIVHFTADTLPLQEVREELAYLGLQLPDDIGALRGNLTLDGSVVGKLNEATGKLVMDSTHGTLDFRLTNTELIDWALLTEMGKKAWMADRLAKLRFAPLEGEVVIDSGLISIPRTEIQSTGVQFFVEGSIDPETGPDMLISIPLRNIGRGLMDQPPPRTGYARAGWKVYLVMEAGKDGETKTKFRLGRRRYFKDRGRLEEYRELKRQYREERKAARRAQ